MTDTVLHYAERVVLVLTLLLLLYVVVTQGATLTHNVQKETERWSDFYLHPSPKFTAHPV